ncbi:MAG: helix-turn-helix domain-containing protein [bacterium]|nr:helix-turn-helix domain-containing protein [bacterium]
MLSPFVSRYWIMRSDVAHSKLAHPVEYPVEHPIVPNGRVKLLFNFADDFLLEYRDRAQSNLSEPIVVGQMSTPALITSTGRIGVMGVEFHPAGALPFLGVPQIELSGTVLDIGMFTYSRWHRELYDGLRMTGDDAARVALMDRALSKLYDRSRSRVGLQALEFVDALNQAGPFASIVEIAQRLNCKPRRLERRFRDYVGLSPKRMQRIMRLQYAFAMHRGRPERSWVELALDAGYFDQPHFIKDFRALTGYSPTDFTKRQTVIAAAFAHTRDF